MLTTTNKIDEIKESTSFQKALEILSKNNQVISTASKRIVNLMTSLKNFASLDQAKYKKININEVIDDTLTLIGHGLDGKINVQKEFGDVPDVLGNPGELNQVLLTVLTNAIQAMGDGGNIRIDTNAGKKDLKIEISDNGKGIPAEKFAKLFDFNFTTKDSRIGFSMGLLAPTTLYKVIRAAWM
jgi:signal transduction histidine kinase